MTVSDDDPVLYEVRDSGVAVLTLNRPERMNGWGGGLATRFYALLDQAEADPAVRAIVVTGSGRAFCAGADMGDLTSIGGAPTPTARPTSRKMVGERHPHFVTTLRKPVIAAINGACAGIGLTQALMCDVRFAAAGAKFTTSFARRGLIAEYGISLDTAARRRLGRRAGPAAVRPGVPRRGGRRARTRQGSRGARGPAAACDRATPRTSPPTARRVRWR